MYFLLKRSSRRFSDFILKFNLFFSSSYRVSFSSRISHSTFGKYCGIGHKTYVASCHLGNFTYIGDNSFVRSASIGSFCSIGSNVQISLGTHPVHDFVSTSPVFYSPSSPLPISFVDRSFFDEHTYVDGTQYNVVIGNDVWIGDKVTICDSVTIGDGAIIAYGSFVTKSVEPYEVVGGTPARHLKYRFTEETRSRLLLSKWWNYPIKYLVDNVSLFRTPSFFTDEI